MTTPRILQTSAIGFADVVNLVGIALLMVAAYYYIQQNNPPSKSAEARARRRGTIAALVFGFYAIVVGVAGHDGTWVGRLGLTLEGQIREFAWEVTAIDERTGATGSPIPGLIGMVKLLGLIAYVAIVSATSFATTAVINTIQSLTP